MTSQAPISLAGKLAAAIPSGTGRDELRTSVLPALIEAVWNVSQGLRTSHSVSLAGTANAFGDDQLNVDVAAENIIRNAISSCPSIAMVSSEEDPVERANQTGIASQSAEQYTIAFDPLDGSSIVAPNWCVGTIVGIWDGASTVGQDPRSKQIAAILGVYGPRTTAVVALRVPGGESTSFEIALSSGTLQEWEVSRSHITLNSPPFKTRYFAPANLRAAAEYPAYNSLISTFISERYTLRYCGGLVPDIVHALVKGHGVYVSPVTKTSAAKLRRLYELYPMALVLECAGGAAVDPADGAKILGKPLSSVDDRAGIVCGTASEVEKVMAVLLA
ncbi:fructose-1-6-bisphosphatase [Sarocladium implicatum]|nr:fructose-1-6-bisphosphatase [Sarocladium implicatum]